MEIDVRGTRVVLRDKLGARDSWPLRNLLAKSKQGDDVGFEEESAALALVVESWGFEGDPHDVESYANLDLADYMALDSQVAQYVVRRMAAPKN